MNASHFLRFAHSFPEPHLLVAGDGTIVAANPASYAIASGVGELSGRRLREILAESEPMLNGYLTRCRSSSVMVPGLVTVQSNGSETTYFCEGSAVGPIDEQEGLVLLRFKSWGEFLERFQRVSARLEEMTTEIRQRMTVVEQLEAERSQLKKRIEYIGAIYKITAALFHAQTLDRVCEEALDSVSRTLRTSLCGILLFDQHATSRFRASEKLSERYRIAVENCCPWTPKDTARKPVLIEDLHTTTECTELKDVMLEEGIRAMCLIPLFYHEKMLGAFMVYYSEPHEFQDEEVRLTQTIAGHVALAIERMQTEESLKSSLEEKKILLQEIHHRVKNNMQVVSSLLSLQAKRVNDARILRMFEESRNRVQSMALIHESLYKSKDLSLINLADYLRELASGLFSFYAVDSNEIRLDIHACDIWLNINTAVPLGLILNELISNSLKHAFPPGISGIIRIQVKSHDERSATLEFSDSGIGLPGTFDFETTGSLGLRLVHILAKQLEGEVTHESSDAGTRFTITFKP